MRRLGGIVCGVVGAVAIAAAAQQAVDPAGLPRAGTDAWPTYNGDYSGRRFSQLTTLNDRNVGALVHVRLDFSSL